MTTHERLVALATRQHSLGSRGWSDADSQFLLEVADELRILESEMFLAMLVCDGTPLKAAPAGTLAARMQDALIQARQEGP